MASFRFAAAAVRQFSTSAARNGEIVQAPIQVFGIEGRYAHALYSAAVKQKKLDAVDKDMQTVQKLIKSDTKFAEFLHSPLLKRSAKTESLSALLKKQGFTDISVNFFETLGENGRLAETTGIVEAFLKITSAEKGEVMCKVTTAQVWY
ncbi:ATP synthase subunit O, mitochondrial-like [Lingula anatina]|uniref:Oligomycin sensitivity conferral protein n=1 Tax=Lingula anatina TaxID=7574 RepID=A0A1S3JYK4_LINAN|nr:ATP synthase subunit O, mitochondrial-like [Lingula anatina]|eukprot:XP_013415372.1 ATP synthase subunit O, mitochondrial-like [Lingula anatina]